MKNTFFFLLAFCFVLCSCQEDDETPLTTNLSYDGDNQSAPFLPSGEHEMAARFPASETSNFEGQRLNEIRFYLVNVPSFCEVRVYGEKSATEPGDLIYSDEVTTGIGPNGWNVHPLNNPIEITGEDLWIAIRVQHSQETNTLGCDVGPADANGDWIISTGTSAAWETFRGRTNGDVDINWNIRGLIE